MRVCYITSIYPDVAARPRGVFIKQMVRTVVERGHDAIVVAPRVYQDALEFEEIEYPNGRRERIYRFNFGSEQRPLATYERIPVRLMLRYFVNGYRCVRRVLRDESPDVVHTHFAVPIGPVASWACRRAGLPWILSVYGTELTWSNSLLARVPGRYAVSTAPMIIGCSEFACDTAVRFGARPEVCHMTFIGGVDTEKFSPAVSAEGVRQRFGIPADARLILFIGNLVPRKRVADLIHALPGILCQTPNVVLFVAGDGPLRSELCGLVSQLNMENRVLMPGAVPNDELPGLLATSDVFVLPSAEEGMGMVLLEAMASGRPVVASRNSGILSVVDEDRNGVLFETGSVEDLIAAVTRVFASEGLATRLGRNAREKAVERFDREKQATDLLGYYNEALRQQAKNTRL